MQFMEQRESEAALLQELEDRGNSKHIGVTHALSFFQILERSLARTLIFSLAPWTLIWRQGLSWLSPGSIPLGAPVAGAEDCRDHLHGDLAGPLLSQPDQLTFAHMSLSQVVGSFSLNIVVWEACQATSEELALEVGKGGAVLG